MEGNKRGREGREGKVKGRGGREGEGREMEGRGGNVEFHHLLLSNFSTAT